MKAHQYALDEIETVVSNELTNTHCNYKYMTEVVFPLLSQNALRKVYPSILTSMKETAEQAIIMGLAKLLDISNDQNVIHFKKFISATKSLSNMKDKNKKQWQEFRKESESFLIEIPGLKRKIDPLRNKFRAHLMPVIPPPPERTTWEFWRKVLERMENIFNLYQGATKDTYTSQFWTTNLDYEPKNFLRWCRLDNFEQHRKEELEKRKNKLRKV